MAMAEAQMAPAKRRRLRRHETDELVKKCIQDNFPSFTAAEVDLNIQDGASLRARLTTDKRKQRREGKSSVCMGSRYYSALRTKYASPDSPVKRLAAMDRKEEVDADLTSSLAAWRKHNKFAVMNWLLASERASQSELVGIPA